MVRKNLLIKDIPFITGQILRLPFQTKRVIQQVQGPWCKARPASKHILHELLFNKNDANLWVYRHLWMEIKNSFQILHNPLESITKRSPFICCALK